MSKNTSKTIAGRTVRKLGKYWHVMEQRGGVFTGEIIYTDTLNGIRKVFGNLKTVQAGK